jgi:hypothetical protein
VALALALAVTMLLGGWALGMPSASADPAVNVYIRDLTPPAVSVDANGTVTFINQIADKTLSVGVGPLAVTAVVHTDVTVNLPSGSHVVKPSAPAPAGKPQPTAADFPPYSQTQQAWTEKFPQSCVTCTISYAYRVDGAQLGQVLGQLPALPAVPTPFVVNTILPLPNLPGVNLPNLPNININVPGQLPGVPNGTTLPGPGGLTTTTTTTTTTTRQPLNAPIAQYSQNGVEMAPSGGGAVRAFDPSRVGDSGGGSAADPAIGNPGLANRSATGPASSGPFSPAALLALVSVAGVATWLARSILARLVADR